MVGVARGHQRADTLKPYSQKTSQSNHTRTTALSNSMKLSHAHRATQDGRVMVERSFRTNIQKRLSLDGGGMLLVEVVKGTGQALQYTAKKHRAAPSTKVTCTKMSVWGGWETLPYGFWFQGICEVLSSLAVYEIPTTLSHSHPRG